jgi:hypothetical protein
VVRQVCKACTWERTWKGLFRSKAAFGLAHGSGLRGELPRVRGGRSEACLVLLIRMLGMVRHNPSAVPMRRAKTYERVISNVVSMVQTPCRRGCEGLARVQAGDLGSPGLYKTGTTQKIYRMPPMDCFRWNSADQLPAAEHPQ